LIRYWIISIYILIGTVIISTNEESVKETVITADMISVIEPRIIVERLAVVTVALPETPTVVKTNKHTHVEKSCPQFEEAFKNYGLEPVSTFSYIAYRESRCRIKAINAKWDKNGNMTWALNKDRSYDSGLLQVNSSWVTVTKNVCKQDISALLTLDCNLKVAKYLLDNGGLNHWGM